MSSRVVLCLIGLLTIINEGIAQTQYGFRIWFTDKAGTQHTLANPLTYLSQRAVDRRVNQSIAIDSTDLPVSAAYMDSALTLTGGKFHLASKWYNYTVLLLTDSADILALQNKPYISGIDYIALYPAGLHKPARGSGNEEESKNFTLPSQAKTTGSALYYGDAYAQTALVNGDYLHDIGWKGEGKVIAVLDEGFANVNTAPAFDSMVNANRISDTYNFANAKTDVFTNGLHGTISLSLMATNLPGTFVGTAPRANYALYITEIGGSEQRIEMDNIMAASERADSIGADVITVSLGYDKFNLPVNSSLTYAEIDGKTTIAARAINKATTKGIFCVVSAGNEGGGVWNYILTPGDADSAMTVGSVTPAKDPAPNSGYGPNSAGRVKPDVCMQGQPVFVMRDGPMPSLSSGTSQSTPQLAGWAACLMQASGNYTPYQLRTAIQKSAHVYNTPGKQLGYGVPNFHYALELLNVKELPRMPDRSNWILASPNPFDNQITLRVHRERNGTIDIRITDVLGRIVHAENAKTGVGVQTITVDTQYLPGGTYFLNAISASEETTLKLLKR